MQKKLLKYLLSALILTTILGNNTAQYCIPTSTSGPYYNTFIDGVEIGTISNLSTGSNEGPNYNDYTSFSTELEYGVSNELKITGSPYYANMYFYAWIDYNQDGDFNDSGELLGFIVATAANQVNSIFFTVPATAKSGSTRLRISTVWNIPGYQPCDDYDFGETEDYNIILPAFSLINTGIPGVWHTSNSMMDIDNDGDLDIFIYGKTYLNNGNNNFALVNEGIPDSYSSAYQDWSDYDNDGDIDVLITGNNSGIKSRVFRNNGDLTFSELDYDLISVSDGSVEWADFNNDSYEDIIITGSDENSEPVGKIYINDGLNGFTDINARISRVKSGAVSVGDYNNDGFRDILMTGWDINGNNICKVFKNEGDLTFTELNINLLGAYHSYVDWGDYDNDGDLDILLVGSSFSGVITSVYKNTGNDGFIDLGLNLEGVHYGACQWGDYDNDGDLDILAAGGGSSDRFTWLFINKGNDIFEESGFGFPGTYGSFITWGDYDNDGDLDFLLTGGLEGNVPSTNLYRNNSNISNSNPSLPGNPTHKTYGNNLQLSWNYSNDNETPAKSLTYNVRVGSSPGAADIIRPNSNLSTAKTLIHKEGNAGTDTLFILKNLKVGTYYWSVQAIDNISGTSQFTSEKSVEILEPFSEIALPFDGVIGNLELADMDNDDDLDMFISGKDKDQVQVTRLYENDGSGNFNLASFNLPLICYGEADWGDYDNDGDLDIAYVATEYSDYEAALFKNNGNWSFSQVTIPLIHSNTVDWGDIDNDGDLDLLLAEYSGITLLRNEGSDQFSITENEFQFSPVGHSVMFGDMDNDGDNDIVFSGYYESCIFQNDGKGNFTKSSAILSSSGNGSIDLGDYDNDGDMDILLSGKESGYNSNKYTRLLRNDRNEQFTEILTDFRGIERGFSSWIDLDSDDDLDVLISGSSGSYITRIFLNQGNDIFTEPDTQFTGILEASGDGGDINNDFNPDFIITGQAYSGRIIAKFINNGNHLYNPPEGPSNLHANSLDYGIILSWDKLMDQNSNIESMSYNVRVGTTSGGMDVVSPMSNPLNGYRKITEAGNAQKNNFFVIDSLSEGTYFWSVQVIDNGFRGGQWAPEQTFEITVLNADFKADTVCYGLETTFTDFSLSSGDPIISWFWDFNDGSSSADPNPLHIFPDYGTHMVKLVIASETSVDSIINEVIVLPRPSVDFSASLACQGTETILTNLTDTKGLNIISWSWDYGDGKGSILEDPVSHGYLNAGEYQLTLYSMADNGCEGSMQKTVTVGAYPIAAVTANAPLTFCTGDSVVLSVDSNPDYVYQWLLNGFGITGAQSPDYTAKASGSYSVEVTNTKGNCKTTSSPVTVTSMEMPAAPVIVTSNYTTGQCQSDNPITLSVDQPVTGYNYQWKRNGVPVNDATMSQISGYLPEGDYSVVAGLSTCRTESAVKTISYDDAPAKPLIHAEGPVVWFLACSDNSAAQYSWFYEGVQIPGANKYIYVANQNLGEYYVSIANTRGCFTSSDVIKIPPDAIGIDETNVFSTLKIFPNPTTGLFTIVMDNQLYGEIIISVFSEEGKKIWNAKFDKIPGYFSCEVDLSRQGSGVFIVSLKAGKNKTSRKVMVE